MNKFYLERRHCMLVLVDIQEKLARVMCDRDAVIGNCLHLIELCKLIKIPMLITEQYPKGLGQTVGELREALPEYRPIEKLTFDCCGHSQFLEELKRCNKTTVILAGMETHVCVLQTCLSLLSEGFVVHVVSDAVSSRNSENKKTALQFMRNAGAVITCTETVLFQLLQIAGTEEFKMISRRIKS